MSDPSDREQPVHCAFGQMRRSGVPHLPVACDRGYERSVLPSITLSWYVKWSIRQPSWVLCNPIM